MSEPDLTSKSASCSFGEHAGCPRDFHRSERDGGYWQCGCSCHAESLKPRTLHFNWETQPPPEQFEAFVRRICARCRRPACEHIHVHGSAIYLCPTVPQFVEPVEFNG